MTPKQIATIVRSAARFGTPLPKDLLEVIAELFDELEAIEQEDARTAKTAKRKPPVMPSF